MVREVDKTVALWSAVAEQGPGCGRGVRHQKLVALPSLILRNCSDYHTGGECVPRSRAGASWAFKDCSAYTEAASHDACFMQGAGMNPCCLRDCSARGRKHVLVRLGVLSEYASTVYGLTPHL